MKSLFLMAAAAAALVLGMTRPTRAVTVANTTTAEVIFDSGGFEGEALGPGPTSALTGSWVRYYNDAVVTGGSPGAYQGTKYVSTVRDNGGAGGPEAHFAANQDFAGDAVHAEFMMYLNPGADEGFILNGGSTFYRAVGRITGGQFANLDPSGSYIYSGLPYATGVWQKWEIDYVIGAASYTVSIDGTSVSVPVYGGGSGTGGDWQGLYFSHNGNDTYYLDGVVPEPASLLLLAGAGAGLMLRRRPPMLT